MSKALVLLAALLAISAAARLKSYDIEPEEVVDVDEVDTIDAAAEDEDMKDIIKDMIASYFRAKYADRLKAEKLNNDEKVDSQTCCTCQYRYNTPIGCYPKGCVLCNQKN